MISKIAIFIKVLTLHGTELQQVLALSLSQTFIKQLRRIAWASAGVICCGKAPCLPRSANESANPGGGIEGRLAGATQHHWRDTICSALHSVPLPQLPALSSQPCYQPTERTLAHDVRLLCVNFDLSLHAQLVTSKHS